MSQEIKIILIWSNEMKSHILLEKAFSYENNSHKLLPENCFYDRKNGLWRTKNTGDVMMVSNFAQRPETKKCDIETGEDQKGE